MIQELAERIDAYLMVINMLAYVLLLAEAFLVRREKQPLPTLVHLVLAVLGGWLGTLMGIVTTQSRKGDKVFLGLTIAAGVIWIVAVCILVVTQAGV